MATDWTDHNTDDPGITVLEALAYDLVDLSYRARTRLLAARCGWRCTVLVAAGVAATIAVLTHQRQMGRSKHPRQARRSRRRRSDEEALRLAGR